MTTSIIQIADADVVRMGALFALGFIGATSVVITCSAVVLAVIYKIKEWVQ